MLSSLSGGIGLPKNRDEFIPEVLPGSYMIRNDPDAAIASISSAAKLRGDTSAHTYDAKESILFKDIPSIDADLMAYLFLGVGILLLCTFVVYGTVLDRSYDKHRRIYTAFPHQALLFIGTWVSVFLICLAAYGSRHVHSTFVLLSLFLVLLVLWSFSLMMRIDFTVAQSPPHNKKSYVYSSGSLYLVLIVVLIVAMAYTSNNTGSTVCLCLSSLWFIYLLFVWMY